MPMVCLKFSGPHPDPPEVAYIIMMQDSRPAMKTASARFSPPARSAAARVLLDGLDRDARASWLELRANIWKGPAPQPELPPQAAVH
jgi:hypothetical protein